MNGISRREFVAGAIATVACSVSVRGAYLAPTTESAGFDAGAVADLKDVVTDKFGAAQKFLIIKKDDKIYAVSSVCLHEKGALKAGTDGNIHCSKHKMGEFDATGKPMAGPPMKKHASEYLTRYGVSITDGHLFVDKTKTFATADDFEKDGAFVKVPTP
jgi:nitrite reductase/ring-hydroxylating ferredoxin subunit